MTYIEYVNAVLVRLREDRITLLNGSSDNVVRLVGALVNDARRQVASAHTWNAYRNTWVQPTTTGLPYVALTNAGKYATIESVYRPDGNIVHLRSLAEIRKLTAQGSEVGSAYFYSPDGVDNNNDLSLRLYPTPDAVESLTIYGFTQPEDLVSDDDVCLLPQRAVVSLAYAMAAAERGEVGGQPTAELFAMAQRDLSDAVALDASLNHLDDVWYS